MSGIEASLVPELQAAVTGKPLPFSAWKAIWRQAPDNLAGGKSGNQSLVALAVAVFLGEPGAIDVAREFLRRSRFGWMGTEEDSSVYGGMHFVAVLAIYASSTAADVKAEALAWLGFWFGLAEACRDPWTGRMIHTGDRSADRIPEPDQVQRGWMRALAAGEDLSPFEQRARELSLGLGGSWLAIICKALASGMRDAWEARSTSGYVLLDPVHVLTWDGGKAVYRGQSLNGNTPALLAATVWKGPDGGPVFTYLPADGGARARGQADEAVLTRDGSRLLYHSVPFGAQEIDLPSSSFEEVIIGGGTAAAPAGPVPAPDDPPAPAGGDEDSRREWRQRRREEGSS